MNCIYSVSSAFTYSEFQKAKINGIWKNSFRKFLPLPVRTFAGEKSTGYNHLSLIRNFRGVKFNRFQKNLKKFSVHLIKQKQKQLLADLEKLLSSKHYYNSHIAFWHDLGQSLKNIFHLCFLPRRTRWKCQTIIKDILGAKEKEKRTGTSACPWNCGGRKSLHSCGIIFVNHWFCEKFCSSFRFFETNCQKNT